MRRNKLTIKNNVEVKTGDDNLNKLKQNKQNKKKKKRRNSHFPTDLILSAIEAVEKGASYRSVAKAYSIPASTLFRKKKFPDSIKLCRRGPPTVLTKEEEEELVQWIQERASTGCPPTKKELMDTVEVFVKNLNRKNPFTDGRPGRHWFEAFMRRHPSISFNCIKKSSDETSNNSLESDDFHADLLELIDVNEVDTSPLEFVEIKELDDKHPIDSTETEPLQFVEKSEVDTEFLKLFEKNLPAGLFKQFINHDESESWTGVVEMKGLYEYWLKIKNTVHDKDTSKENAVTTEFDET